MKQTAIDEVGLTPGAPVPGAKAVYWLTKGQYGLCWKHMGWLMPQVGGRT